MENLKAIVEKAIIDAKAVLKGLKDDLELYAQEMIEQGLADLEAKAKEVFYYLINIFLSFESIKFNRMLFIFDTIN